MKKNLTCAGILVFLSAGIAVAQFPCNPASTTTDQERFVRTEIQSRIDESIEADQAKDLAAKTHYFAPDYTLVLEDGTVLDRNQAVAEMERDAEWVLSVSDRTDTEVQCIELKGTQAVVLTQQHFVRTVPDRKDGSPHELITSVRHRETWVYTSDGWMVKRIQELEHGPMYLDGKVYVQ